LKRNLFPFSLSLFQGILFLFLAVGCDNPTAVDSKAVFRYNEFRNITSLDPAFARNPQNIWPIQQLFNGLVQLDYNLNVVPEIAAHWEIDSLGTTYTFFLKEDIFFHKADQFGPKKTRAVTAHDFVYSFDRLTDPAVGSPGGWVLQQIKSYQAIDQHIFQIQLKQTFPAFLSLLSMRYCAVVPKEVVEDPQHAFRKHPIGTGPFQFKAWEEDIKLVLRKNPHYFERDNQGKQLPYLEAIAISFLPDIQSEFMLFSQGKFDFLNSIDPSYKDELLTSKGTIQAAYQDEINLQKGPYLNTEYIGFYLDSDNPALQSNDIRKAINIGFDRVKMITYLRNTIGFPALEGFIPKGLAGKTTQTINEYQPELARTLVKQFVEATNIQPTIRLATDINYLDICEYLQRELQKIGITVVIELMPTATLRQVKSSGKVEAFRASWIADYPDAENYLSLFYSANFSPGGPNYTHFKQEEFDTLYEAALLRSTLKERLDLYQQMDEMIMNYYPVVPLYYDQAVRFVQKDVKGLEMNPLNLLYLKSVYKTTH
jgi:ABC-type transport system substrate-binding protein